jgi:hypothetical protein
VVRLSGGDAADTVILMRHSDVGPLTTHLTNEKLSIFAGSLIQGLDDILGIP